MCRASGDLLLRSQMTRKLPNDSINIEVYLASQPTAPIKSRPKCIFDNRRTILIILIV